MPSKDNDEKLATVHGFAHVVSGFKVAYVNLVIILSFYEIKIGKAVTVSLSNKQINIKTEIVICRIKVLDNITLQKSKVVSHNRNSVKNRTKY